MLSPHTSLLVVDDEPLLCKNMSIIFTALGYATRAAPDGFSALAAIREEIPDIVLSDLNMPGMSGFEFLSVIRRRFPSVRVVAMSSKFAGTTVPPGVAADAFYQKGSHRPHALLAAVESMKHPQESEAVRIPSRSDAPIWIPTNGHDPSGEPYVMISCPECLRAFPQVLGKNAARMRSTKCAHCSNPIQYAIIHSMKTVPPAPQQLGEVSSSEQG